MAPHDAIIPALAPGPVSRFSFSAIPSATPAAMRGASPSRGASQPVHVRGTHGASQPVVESSAATSGSRGASQPVHVELMRDIRALGRYPKEWTHPVGVAQCAERCLAENLRKAKKRQMGWMGWIFARHVMPRRCSACGVSYRCRTSSSHLSPAFVMARARSWTVRPELPN
jgi:hypothetical protein